MICPASLIFLIGNLAIGSLPLSKERKATRHVIAQHPAKGLRDLVREPRNLVRAKSECLSASDWNPCPRYPGARKLGKRAHSVLCAAAVAQLFVVEAAPHWGADLGRICPPGTMM